MLWFARSENGTIMKSDPTSATKIINVLIADDHPVVREGLELTGVERDAHHNAGPAAGRATNV